MPKLKTHKTTSKRIHSIRKSGSALNVSLRRMSAQHLATNKNSRSTHAAGHNITITKKNARKLRKLVPYR